MNIPIPENSITINGRIYVLVDDEEPDECLRCALRGKCDTQNLLCQILDDAPQGKRFEKMDVAGSPWHTIIDGEGIPTTRDMVIGVYIQGPEHYAGFCWRDPRTGDWYDADGDLTCEPDYWIEDPSESDYADKRRF